MDVHPTAIVDAGATIGAGTRIWQWTHVMAGASIGERCTIGQGCFVGTATIGNGCKIQNGVSIFDGVTLDDDVFVGPACVFTNVKHPRAHVSRKAEYAPTRVGRGATIGANATVICGVTIGPYAMIGAGAVISRDIAAHALVVGGPAHRIGWACRCGETLSLAAPTPTAPPERLDGPRDLRCTRCGDAYVETNGVLSPR